MTNGKSECKCLAGKLPILDKTLPDRRLPVRRFFEVNLVTEKTSFVNQVSALIKVLNQKKDRYPSRRINFDVYIQLVYFARNLRQRLQAVSFKTQEGVKTREDLRPKSFIKALYVIQHLFYLKAIIKFVDVIFIW